MSDPFSSLTSADKRLLRRIARRKVVRHEVSEALLRAKLVVPNAVHPDGQGGFYADGYRINDPVYRRYRERLSDARRSNWRETRRFWIPLIVSNLIALASLAVSVLALLQGRE